MDISNALGLTVAAVAEVDMVVAFDAIDSDSVTVVSMQSIPNQGRGCAPFPPRLQARPWRLPRTEQRSPLSTWFEVGSRLRTRVNNVRRHLPALFKSLFTGHGSMTQVVPHPIFTVSISTYQCAACQTGIELMQEDAVLVPCGHQYHADCIVALVESSIQSFASFPPQCCRQTISTDIFDRYLSPSQRASLAERQSEHTTPKRVYCANPRCSRFLGARDKRFPVRIYTCPTPSCSTHTCARCKARVDGPGAAAARHECSHDPGHRATLRLGSRMGWVRCPTCEELIERHSGCAHMTCVCGTQFCYRCCAVWKTCNCVDWGDGVGADPGEGRLFAPLEEGGDLGAQLALYVPLAPGMEENVNASGEAESDGNSSDADPTLSHGGFPSHTQRDNIPQPTAVTTDVDSEIAMAASAAFAYIENSTKSSPILVQGPTRIVDLDPDPDTTSSCFPFFVDPYLLARGLQAQEIRLRRHL